MRSHNDNMAINQTKQTKLTLQQSLICIVHQLLATATTAATATATSPSQHQVNPLQSRTAAAATGRARRARRLAGLATRQKYRRQGDLPRVILQAKSREGTNMFEKETPK